MNSPDSKNHLINNVSRESSDPVDFDPFAGAPELVATAPSTEPQREIWAAAALNEEAACAYNESICLFLDGRLDAAALGRALHALAQRHESLRASFGPDGASLCIAREIPLDLEVVEATDGLDVLREREVLQPFDLTRGPLFRCRVVRLCGDRHAVLITAHHTVCDGWSFGVLLHELAALYNAFARGERPRLPPAPGFAEYAERQARRDPALLDEQLQWWRQRLAGINPRLELPTDHPRPPRRGFRAGFLRHTIPADVMQSLRARGARVGCTPYTVLAAAVSAWLHRLSGQRDFVLGVPAAGQAVDDQLHGLVGHCVSLLPVPSRLDRDAGFDEHLAAFGEALTAAREHHECSMGRIVQALGLPRDPAVVPLVQVVLNVDRRIGAPVFNGLDARFEGTPRRFENFEMFINAVDGPDGTTFECTFDATLYSLSGMRARLQTLQRFFEGLARDNGPVAAVDMLAASDRARLSEWTQGPQRNWPVARVDALVRAQARRTPDAIAASSGNARMTYAQLLACAGRVRDALAHAHVERGARVGVLLERDVRLPAVLLGVLEAGAAYLPLDPELPASRLAWLLGDAGATHLIIDSMNNDGATADAPADFGGRIVDFATLHPGQPAEAEGEKAQFLNTPADTATSTTRSPNHFATGKTANDAAYVIYTSGSTGRPKGVVVPHRAIVNFLRAMHETLAVNDADVFLALTTLGFDIAVLELWLPLVIGARCEIVPRALARDGRALRERIERSGATVVQATPATWQLLLAAGWQGSAELTALSGGEALSAPLAAALRARSGRAWNLYGPTETTVWSTAQPLDECALDRDRTVPIGRPLANTRVHVLDGALRPVPPHMPGELCIGGAGVADGYLDRPELTRERFIKHPEYGRLYRTGDRVRFDRDGRLEYLGRLDFQIKLRGHRIEPGEIETALEAHPSVSRAAVVLREVDGDPRLVACVVPRGGERSSADALRAHLKRELPAYMLPQHFIELNAMPLTASGKIDRRALPAPDGVRATARIPPATATETRIAALWRELLGVDEVFADDNFFELGGHSLLAARFVVRWCECTGVELRIAALFEEPVLRDLATQIDTLAAGERRQTIEI